MSKVSQTNNVRISLYYTNITHRDGIIIVDEIEAPSANTVVNAISQIETAYGEELATDLIGLLERWSNRASDGHKVEVRINTNTGSLSGNDL